MRIASPHPQIYVHLQNIEILSSLNVKNRNYSKIIPTKATKNTISFRNIRIAFNIVTGFSVLTFFFHWILLNWNANIAVYRIYTPAATKKELLILHFQSVIQQLVQ